MKEVITGAEACDKYGLTVKQLAQACDRGELVAYSDFHGKQIFSASMCKATRKYPQKFGITSPKFIPEEILLHMDTYSDFNIYINDKLHHFGNTTPVIKIGNENDCFYKFTNKNKLQCKIIIEPKDLTQTKNMLVSIIFRRSTYLFVNELNNRFFHINEFIHVNTCGKLIHFKMEEHSNILPLIENYVIRKSLYKKGFNEITCDDWLEFLWNNTFDYYKPDASDEDTNINEDVFNFDFDAYKKYNLFRVNADKSIEDEYKSKLLNFKNFNYDVNRIANLYSVLNINIISAKDYINKVYNNILETTNDDKTKIYIDAYLSKIDGKSLGGIRKMLFEKYKVKRGNDHISKMVSTNIKNISSKHKIPYIEWQCFTGNHLGKYKKSNEEIVKDIKEQLDKLHSKD